MIPKHRARIRPEHNWLWPISLSKTEMNKGQPRAYQVWLRGYQMPVLPLLPRVKV